MKIKKSIGERVFDSFNYILLGLLGLCCLYPLWYTVCAAFTDPVTLSGISEPLLYPVKFSFESVMSVLNTQYIMSGYAQSIKLLIFGTIWQLICTVIAAYALSRRDFLLRRPIMLMITFTMFFNGGMIPTYLNYQELGFGPEVGLISLIIPFSLSTYNMIIMRTAIESMPESLVEAARIDGAGHMKVIWNLVLPLTKATIAVLTMWYAVSHWNSWFWAHKLLDRKDQVLSVALKELLDPKNSELDPSFVKLEGMRQAAVVVGTLPILAMYPFVQRYFTQGMMVGAVKQ